MDRRRFMRQSTALGLAAGTTAAVRGAPLAASAPVLLTICGAISRPDRGPFDPSRDVLMGKHGVTFESARTYRYADLLAMPQETIRPTLEYDARAHALSGPRLAGVLDHAGAPEHPDTPVMLRAFDGYSLATTRGELEHKGFILALSLDGTPMALGGLGPLWALFDADRIPEVAERPLAQRFAGCPWGLYCIVVGGA